MRRLIALALLVVVPVAHAGVPRCNAPPYGVSPAAYVRVLDAYRVLFQAKLRITTDPAADEMLAERRKQDDLENERSVNTAFEAACRAKLEGKDADKYRHMPRLEAFDVMGIAQVAGTMLAQL